MSAHDLLMRSAGLNLSPASAERAMRERMRKCHLRNPDEYLRQMTPAELKQLIELVVVPESWMFRDPGAFAVATAFVRKRLAASARPLRILSIPCAGGEEPYSMAMALADAGVARDACTIDAFDLSALAIERARAGLYTRNAFRGANLEFRERYFSQQGDLFQINDAIRAQVCFKEGNLLQLDVSANAGAYDVVFCRNLLIYFDEPTTVAAIAKLHALLADEGLMLAGYAEVPAFCGNGFLPLRLPGAFALQKETVQQAPAPRAPARARALPSQAPLRPPVRAAAQAAPAAAAPDCAGLLATARKQADLGDFAAATASCKAVLATVRDSADAYFILGLISECQDKSGAADDNWRRCVYLEPDHYEALCHLALLAERTGDAVQAAGLRQRAARVYQRQQAGATTKSVP